MESTPKCLQNYYSLKKVTLNVLASIQDTVNKFEESTTTARVVILTGNGTYKGTIITELATKDDYLVPEGSGHTIDMTIISEHRNQILLNTEAEGLDVSFVDNGAFIYLKDVESIPLSTNENSIKFPYLMIFADQIVGFSLMTE